MLFKHEESSTEMLKYIIQKYDFEKELKKYGLNMEYHVELICEFIRGGGKLLVKNHFLYQVKQFLTYLYKLKFIIINQVYLFLGCIK